VPGSGGNGSASRPVLCSGCGELELAQGVEGAFADLAGDGQSCDGGVAARAGGLVEGEVGGGCAVRVHGRLDQRPAQMRRAGLGQVAAGSRRASR
jgi:hypothetical protein